MALDKNDLLSLIATNLPDNTEGLISPSDVRTVLSQMVDSDVNLLELTEQVIAGLINVASIKFQAATPPPPWSEGQVFYDGENKALSYYNNESNTLINAGQEVVIRVYNDNGSTITNGQPVRAGNAAVGGIPTAIRAQADTIANANAVGVATHDIPAGQTGFITYIGKVGGLNTAAYSVGDRLYVDPLVPGALTNIAPEIVNVVGIVLISDAVDGSIIVGPSEVAVPFAVGQAIDTVDYTQSGVGTTPMPALGYPATPSLEVNTDVTLTADSGSYRASISPSAPPFSGFYRVSFSASVASSGNVLLSAEIYINGSPTGVGGKVDFNDNNTNAGTVAISAITNSSITDTDGVEVYFYTDAGTTNLTIDTITLNIERLGIA